MIYRRFHYGIRCPLIERADLRRKKITERKPLLVGSGMKTGCSYQKWITLRPSAVTDRVAVAANAKYKGLITIADMGTATTLDVVDHDGNYIGGVILSSVKVVLNSLVSNTAQLPRISFDVPKRCNRKKRHRMWR